MSHAPVRFVLAIHNHQPVGNFGWTIEQAYQDSYLPFLDVFSEPKYESLKISLHNSGCLTDWLETHHPEYLDRLAELVAAGRVEILGGTYYEAILGMLPSRDRIGQIQRFTRWLEMRLGGKVRGMWMPERVWEASFVQDLAAAGIEYTVVDDFHMKKAGLTEDQLFGYVATEDNGAMMGVFPGSEKMRYWIPFHEPKETVEYCKKIRKTHPHAILVFGDDGEKFGTWPGTHTHVYKNGWLETFFDALVENAKDIRVVTLAEAYDEVKPLQKLYVPECSYREMTEWVLPAHRLMEYESAVKDLQKDDPLWQRLRGFLSGANWRNFKVKYPETNEMYARMMYVSCRLAELETRVLKEKRNTPEMLQTLDAARADLYRGQCNCSYWHGAFGGVYLPVLRDAVYSHLIAADTRLDEIQRKLDGTLPAISVEIGDFDFDLHPELRVMNGEMTAWLSPHRGGTLYELDIPRVPHNLLATLARREEAYHRKILLHRPEHDGDFASIHDRVVFKQEGLQNRLQYDGYLRKSMTDLFFPPGTTLEDLFLGNALPGEDFAGKPYSVKATETETACEITFSRSGEAVAVNGETHEIRIVKTFRTQAGEPGFRVHYQLQHLPQDAVFHFGSEFHFAGMPANCDDRYFYAEILTGIEEMDTATAAKNATEVPARRNLGHLGTRLDLVDAQLLGLVDEWLKLDVRVTLSRPARVWTYPVETVSNSEGGFELVHQSVAVVPNWFVQGDAAGCWETEIAVQFPEPGK